MNIKRKFSLCSFLSFVTCFTELYGVFGEAKVCLVDSLMIKSQLADLAEIQFIQLKYIRCGVMKGKFSHF